MRNIDDRLAKIEEKIMDKDFLKNKGLGNEVGYYIFDYYPRDELYVRSHIAYLKEKINKSNCGIKVVEFDLYNLINVSFQHTADDIYLNIQSSTCIESEKKPLNTMKTILSR